MKDKLFKELQAALSETDQYNLKNPAGFYPFSNENGVEKVIEKLSNRAPRKPHQKYRVAVLVGQSSFCSLLPELSAHVDFILFSDIDKRAIIHNFILLETLNQAKTLKHFEQLYPFKAMQYFKSKYQAKEALLQEKQRIGEKSFLSNPKRYQECRDQALSIRFLYKIIDLLDPNAFRKFQKTLNKYQLEISLINVSNIFEYDSENISYWGKFDDKELVKKGNLLHNLKTIPNKPLIMYSIRKDAAKTCDLHAGLTRNYNRFVKKNKHYTKKTLETINSQGLKFKAITPLLYRAKGFSSLPKTETISEQDKKHTKNNKLK